MASAKKATATQHDRIEHSVLLCQPSGARSRAGCDSANRATAVKAAALTPSRGCASTLPTSVGTRAARSARMPDDHDHLELDIRFALKHGPVS
jgi:hypothetical protein